jgi:hypothetical protein
MQTEPEYSQPIADQVRARLQWAYDEKQGVVGSISEIFSGKRTKRQDLPRGRAANGFSATRVHATETRKPGRSHIPISGGRSGGDIRRAVYQLPPLEQHWVHHCYNPSTYKKNEADQHLALELFAELRDRMQGKHATTQSIALLMTRLQLEQSRSYAGFLLWSPSKPPQLADMSRASWGETHKPTWIAIHHAMLHTDNRAMMMIYSRIE